MVKRRTSVEGCVSIVLTALLSCSVAAVSQKPLNAINLSGGLVLSQDRPDSTDSKHIRIASLARPGISPDSSRLVLNQHRPGDGHTSEKIETTDVANERWAREDLDYVNLKLASKSSEASSEAVDDTDSDDSSFRDEDIENLVDSKEVSEPQNDKKEPHRDRNNLYWPYFWSTDGFHILSDTKTTPNIVPYAELCKDWMQGPKAQALGLFFLFFLIISLIEGASFLFRHSRKLILVFPRGQLALQGQEKQLRAFCEDIEARG